MKLYICIVFIITSFFHAQANNEKQIDLILENSLKNFNEIKFNESLKKANHALKISEKNNYSKGKAASCIYIAKVLLEVGAYNEGLYYLEKAEKEPFVDTAVNFKTEVCRLRGRAYGNLKMYTLAGKEFHKQIQYSYKIKDSLKRNFSLVWAHQNLSQIFELQNKRDSLWKHLKSQESILKKMNEKEVYHMLYTTYTQKADEYIAANDLPRAEFYLQKAFRLLKKYHVSYQHDALEVLGKLMDKNGNKKKAIEYYEKALQNAIAIGDGDGEKHLYKVLGNYYTENKLDIAKANEYLYKYQSISDSIDLHNKQAVEAVLAQIVEKKDKEITNSLLDSKYLNTLILIFSFLIISFFYFKSKRQKLLLEKKEQTIEEKQVLTEELTGKLNDKKFYEVIRLAKNYSPEFIILFKEVYPEFYNNLTSKYQNLTLNDIKLCAFIKLNFSNKEIAEYDHISLRTVESKKYRLRKKLNLSGDVDFNVWIRNM
ncbi:LuxR C-terminal-related transcriptional regulator [Chryseobacterium antibioticum]|uniref:LuxR C-terminal-related transcriptional regulator n=1 Tax=Chryseobacterium pyrolae TaxID=2987481 RepID=A0ABT2ILD7_9FLAO|nr:LuxR C-terminal-related transcriptional regulator [Chryseobacterium pyrolae]MCT2409461.1 LuxR C-terminal-related transcriptional regulator [Chryseobacterium pyrolae]